MIVPSIQHAGLGTLAWADKNRKVTRTQSNKLSVVAAGCSVKVRWGRPSAAEASVRRLAVGVVAGWAVS